MRILFAWLAPALVCSGLSQQVGAQVVLNEIHARNATGLTDEDGEFSDWIELHNPGPGSLNLSGWYLTDDSANLMKWKLPRASIAARGYLLVFASSKNRAVVGKPLHTNFQLDGDGEYLALVRSDGRTVASAFAPDFPEQRTDISWGRRGSASGFAYFTRPSPGAVNGLGLSGLTDPAEIAFASGHYQTPFATEIKTTTSGAAIHYTMDGGVPTESSNLYTGPIQITTTTALRACAFKKDHVPSLIDTRTFIFVETVVRQPARPNGFPSRWGNAPAVDYEMDPQIVKDPAYQQEVRKALRALPTLSLVLDTADMFGSRGIYSNPQSSGPSWERSVSAELFGGQVPGFRIDCGLRVQGGASRSPQNSPKHSLSLRFRNRYGKGRLQYAMFAGSRVDEFDSLHLRAEYNNSWIHWSSSQRGRGMMIRDQWMRDSQIAMGHEDAGRGTYIHLYINGLYWGVSVVQERQAAAHYASWFGGGEDDYDARNGSAYVNGNSTAWNAMVGVVRSGNWTATQKVLDVDHYIDWTILQYYGGNSDLKTSGNWRAAGGGSSSAPWRFYSWDAEHVLESPSMGSPRPSSDPPGLRRYLVGNQEFVVRFGDRLHRHFFDGGALTPESVVDRYAARAAELDLAIVAESARWGDYRRDVHSRSSGPYELYTRNQHFRAELSRLLKSYFPGRSRTVLNRFRGLGLYPSTAAPTFSKHGGRVPERFRLQMSGSGAIYYTLDDDDPRLPGGGVSPRAIAYGGVVTLTKTTLVKARVRAGSSWSALTEALFVVEHVSVNEILALNRTGIKDQAGEREDWIELHNSSNSALDIGGYYLTDRPDDLTKWRLPVARTIKAGGTLLIWADEDGNQGPLHANFKLSPLGEQVLLVHRDGKTVIDRFDFGPQQADVSTGRFYDGAPRLVTFPDPTPRLSNEIADCGSRRYSALDPGQQPMTLALEGKPGLGKPVTLVLAGGPPRTLHGIFLATKAGEQVLVFSATRLLLALPFHSFVVATSNSSGTLRSGFTVPQVPRLAGKSLFFQGFSASAAGIGGSAGLEIKFCR